MPITIIRVAEVRERPVKGGYLKYDILPAVHWGTPHAATYETFDPMKASLCQRAAELDFPVEILWKDSRYGREIVTVTREGNAEAVAS